MLAVILGLGRASEMFLLVHLLLCCTSSRVILCRNDASSVAKQARECLLASDRLTTKIAESCMMKAGSGYIFLFHIFWYIV